MARRLHPDPNSVFLNVPFDKGYERTFVTLVCGIIVFGRSPRCVLEIREQGQGRLARLIALIEKCTMSVHDLSRVNTPVRFNMPFELGLACAIAQTGNLYEYVLLEKNPHRLDKTLSDIKGRDPHIHGGTIRKTLNCIFDIFVSAAPSPDFKQVLQLERQIWKHIVGYKRQRGHTTVFNRSVFIELVHKATLFAQQYGMIS